MVLYKNKKRPRHMNADDFLNHKRELSRRSSLAYYHRNKERINNLIKENKENKEFIDKIKNYRKSYYQLNKEKIKQRTKDYYNKYLKKKVSTPLKDITEQIKVLSNMAKNLKH